MSAVSERETSRGVLRLSSLASSSGLVNLLLFLLSLAIVSTIATSEPSLIQPHHLQKRNIAQLCDLIFRFTGRPCLDYLNYGCQCGQLNPQGDPADDVDRCCQAHRSCWDNASCILLRWLVTYEITCTGTSCDCDDSPTNEQCKFSVCQCDLIFAQCLQSSQYNVTHGGNCPQ